MNTALRRQIRQFIDETSKTGEVHSVMVLQHGKKLVEKWFPPYTAEIPHICYSVTKTVTCTAIGFAVQEKLLSPDDPIYGFFKDKLSFPLPPNQEKITVHHLLTMSCGHGTVPDIEGAEDWAAAFFEHPVPYEPGTHFLYSNPGSHMLACILRRVTGEGPKAYLQPRLWDPLEIRDIRWDTDPQGTGIGGYGLFLKTEELAKLGQFYLQKGIWNGKELLSADWIRRATSKQIDTPSADDGPDWRQGYCYQLWRCQAAGAYRMDGYKGQFVIILPEQDAVVVMTQDNLSTQKVLQLIWDILLPALDNCKE